MKSTLNWVPPPQHGSPSTLCCDRYSDCRRVGRHWAIGHQWRRLARRCCLGG